MATKKDLIYHFSEQLKKKDEKIEAMHQAVEDITRMLDAILYEVCLAYSNEDDKHITFKMPKMEKDAGRGVHITVDDHVFTCTPVKKTDGEEQV